MSAQTLPVIDFAGASDETLARQLDQAFTDIGFCYFRGIGVDQALVDGVFEASRRFHAQPRAAKDAIAMNSFHRGYMAPKTSIIQTSSVAKVTKPNDSESFMLMHEVAPDDPRYGRPLDGPNLWPDLPGFREPVEAYETAMHAFCLRLLGADGAGARPAARLVRSRTSSSRRRSCACCITRRMPRTRPTMRSARRRTPTTASSPSSPRTGRAASKCGARTAPGWPRRRSTARGW